MTIGNSRTSKSEALPGPVVWTERVLLRPPLAEDAADIERCVRDPEVTRFLLWDRPGGGMSVDEFLVRAALDQAAGRALTYVLEDRRTSRVLGCCSATGLDISARHIGELGYWLARSHWGQGLMPEALRGFLPVLFGRVGVHRLTAQVFTENARSLRLLERLGFQREGTLRHHVRKGGRAYDMHQYALLSSDAAARGLLARSGQRRAAAA